MLRRYGPELGPLCIAEMQQDRARRRRPPTPSTASSPSMWPALRSELAPMALPVERDGGGAEGGGRADDCGRELGLPREVWHDAIRYAREIRGRWSFLNLAADAGLLEGLLEGER